MDALEHSEALKAFDHAAQELRFFKTQQWQVANYVLLAHAALVAAPQLVASSDYVALARIIGAAVAVGATIFGWQVLHSLDLALDKERDRMKRAHEKLSLLWSIHAPTHATSRFDAGALLRTAIVVGAATVIGIDIVALTS